MTTDVKLNKDKDYWDFEWTAAGDISTDQSLDTAILMSTLCEVSASPSEVANNLLRRGWIGNESTPDFEQGSKSWLFEQERTTGSTLSDLGPVVRNGYQWMIDDIIATGVQVEQPFLKSGSVVTFINMLRDGSPVDRRFFEIWNNTFKDGAL